MAHVFEHQQLRAGDERRRAFAAAGCDEGVVQAVDDQGRHAEFAQGFGAEPLLRVVASWRAPPSGCSMAIVWAMVPPKGEPITWARSMPKAVSRPRPSSAMSLKV